MGLAGCAGSLVFLEKTDSLPSFFAVIRCRVCRGSGVWPVLHGEQVGKQLRTSVEMKAAFILEHAVLSCLMTSQLTGLSQAAGSWEENLLRGRWGACSRAGDEETGRFVPGEAGGTEKENFTAPILQIHVCTSEYPCKTALFGGQTSACLEPTLSAF